MCYSLADVVVGNRNNCLFYKRKEKEKNRHKKPLRLLQKQIGTKMKRTEQ